LKNLFLFGKESQDFTQGKEILSRAGIKDTNHVRRLLVKLNVWSGDENLDLYRLKIKTEFSKSALKEVEALTQKEFDPAGREDLRDLSIFTIDGPLTRDFDDALSLEQTNNGFRLGVHIVDLTTSIKANGSLDKEAFHRASSIYLPYHQIPMLPADISSFALSLIKDQDRPAISLLADFDNAWNLKNYRFTSSLIRVKRQLTYDYVDTIYADDPIFSALYNLAESLKQKRILGGALLIPLPELYFETDDDSNLQVKLTDQDSPAWNIVSECMILYNRLTAQFASEAALPIIYRAQEQPQEKLVVDESGYIYYVFQQRRKLRPLIVDTIPHPHSGLGVELYTNVTSPLRRYTDMVVQRQIHSAILRKFPVYTESRLKEIHMSTRQTLSNIALMRRNRTRYWMLKYLSRYIDKSYDVIIFQKLRAKYLVILTDFLFIAELPAGNCPNLSPGDKVRVAIKKSNPWDDILITEYDGRQVDS